MNLKYRYCGLVLESGQAFPELQPVDANETTDIRIQETTLGAIPSDARAYGPNWAVSEREGWWWLGDKIYFRIRPGEIAIDNRNTEHALARALLLEAPMVMAMIFRGIFCLSAASVLHNGKTILFCGASGCGRSTAAARLALRGGHLISDSLARLAFSEGKPFLVPQGSGSLMWPHSLSLLNLSEQSGTQLRTDSQIRRINLAGTQEHHPVEHVYWRSTSPTNHAAENSVPQRNDHRKTFSFFATITVGRLWIDAANQSIEHFQWCLAATRSLRVSPPPKLYFNWQN